MTIRISEIWTAGKQTIKDTVIFRLIEKLSGDNVEFTKPKNADILFCGPYNQEKISRRIYQKFLKIFNIDNPSKKILEISSGIFFKKKKPILIYYGHENFRYDNFPCDFYIGTDFEISENYLRFPVWKENINWKDFGIHRSRGPLIQRYGEYYDVKKLLAPLGSQFLKRKNFCIITSHLKEPRRTIYQTFSNHFKVDGYGSFFNKKIKNHNASKFFKKDILKNYAFNLCPHNSIYPGLIEEKVAESFLSGCLPITWADSSIDHDFNPKAFVNLNDYFKDNFKEIINLLKQKEFVEKFSYQPLLLSEPNLEKEIKFVKRIIDYI